MAYNARKVVVFGHGYENYQPETDVLRPHDVATIVHVAVDDPDAEEQLRTADAILVRETLFDAERIDRLERCRVIVRYGVGTDNIDLDAAARRRIYVANVPDYGTDEVALHTLALVLAVVRRIATADRTLREAGWSSQPPATVRRLRGRVLGLIGFGRIAEAFFGMTAGLGFARTLVYDPYRTDPLPTGVEATDLDRLCQTADVISLHVPLAPDTHHLLNRARIGMLKPNAIVVNTARGGLIDETALAEALREDRLYGAGLDVFEQEPPDPLNPLLAEQNVVATNHMAWYSEQSREELTRRVAEDVRRVLDGDAPRDPVTPESGW